MSIAMLRPTATPGAPRTRWAWNCLLAAALVAGAGCDQRNLAVFSLDALPSGAMAITPYYRLDGGEWKVLDPKHALLQFGIELPAGRSVKLETQVFSYANRNPCSLGNAAGTAELDGGSIRELTLSVTPTSSRCNTASEPVDFPPGKMVVWANAESDIWLAGSGGKIVHWNGAAYTKVALPAALVQTPPDWNAILGDGPDMWLAGTNRAVVFWSQNSGTLSGVPNLRAMPTDWRSIATAIVDGGSISSTVVLAGTNQVIGIADASSGVAPLPLSCSGGTPAGQLTAVGCPRNGTEGRCFFVTDKGGIASLQLAGPMMGLPICKNITSPKTTALLDVFVGLNQTSYDVRIVGKAGVALRGTTPVVKGPDPSFMDYSSSVPQSQRVDLNSVSGASLDALWIAGQGGVLLRWQNTPPGMSPTAQFASSPTGITADLGSLSGFGDDLFFSGTSHTLGYIGPLFKPH